ncbi:MAG: hypothetical protein VYE22_18610 [Myxococcota bacterium]|nr:hypothetical protein [Myxococcota bacterium]
MKRVWVCLLLCVSATASADEAAPVSLELAPWASFDGVDRPYRYVVELRPRGTDPVEVVADRRLLSFEVRPNDSRRRYRCRHPQAPRSAPESRVRTLTPGGAEDGSWREWIDLRMYCTGRALRALDGGAEVRVRYGWPRRTRRRWVTRAPGSSWRSWTGGLEHEPLVFPLMPELGTRRLDTEDGASLVEAELLPGSARTEAGVRLRTALRATEGSHQVYVRPDDWSFRVEGPDGVTICRAPRGGGDPPPDLYRRVTTRAAVRHTLEASFFCPRGTFERAGVYEVTPKLRLEHSGEAYGLDALVGRFSGPPAPIRVTRGEGGYVEQVPQAPDEAEADE